jgi:hypothetical protein
MHATLLLVLYFMAHAIGDGDARYFTSDALLLSQCDALLMGARGEASKKHTGLVNHSVKQVIKHTGVVKHSVKQVKQVKHMGGIVLSATASLFFFCVPSVKLCTSACSTSCFTCFLYLLY